MSTKLHIALVQPILVWENPEANRAQLEKMIKQKAGEVDLFVLPEMFSSGFTMQPQNLDPSEQLKTVDWMKSLARVTNAAIAGSLAFKENGLYFNRLFFVYPTAEVRQYDKRHLFSLAGEEQIYQAGKQRLVLEYNGFRICPLICYDLRFPVFSRNTEQYDVLLYVANWPKARIYAWDSLLKARAVENISYAVGVNRVGEDQNGHHYNGHSQVLDELGHYLVEPQENEGVFTAILHKEKLLETRQRLNFLADRDNFSLI